MEKFDNLIKEYNRNNEYLTKSFEDFLNGYCDKNEMSLKEVIKDSQFFDLVCAMYEYEKNKIGYKNGF